MNAKTLKALRGSIRKWERIVAGTGSDNGPHNCPLCRLFFWNREACEGCPVAAKTGRAQCDGTPYRDYDWSGSKEDARRELNFLKSLLPKKSKTL